MTYAEAEALLLALPRFAERGAAAYQPGLERMRALMDAMGSPHEAFPSVHVAGTNGKGSTASLLAAVATAAGRRTGLHTSPHLLHLAERLRLDGRPAPEAWIAGAVARYRDAFEALRPSFFEATTALAFRYFADEQVDCAVVEVGLGGRLDATNVLQPRLAVITNIGLEHTDLLGTTLAEIAREKAGIIKPGVPVVTAVDQPEALAVLREVAAAREAALHSIHEEAAVRVRSAGLGGLVLDAETPRHAYPGLHVGLPGAHQRSNAVLAVCAAELAFPDVAPGAVAEGLRAVRALAGLRGRLDVLGRAPLVVADVAHNADGLAAALAFIDGHRDPEGRLHVLLGLMRDKDAEAIAAVLAGAAGSVFVAALPTERAWPPEALAGSLRAAGVEVAGSGTVEQGHRRFRQQAAPHDALLAAGSHHVVAALLGAESPGGGGA